MGISAGNWSEYSKDVTLDGYIPIAVSSLSCAWNSPITTFRFSKVNGRDKLNIACSNGNDTHSAISASVLYLAN